MLVRKAFSLIDKRSVDRSDTQKVDRKQYVGLKTKNPKEVLPERAQAVWGLTNSNDHRLAMLLQGVQRRYCTLNCFSRD